MDISNQFIEIRKEFTFNNAHIVRNCSSDRCKYTAHAHTYRVEVFLKSDKLDNGYMAVDFGLLKGTMKSLIKMFDNTYSLWCRENQDYKDFVYKNFERVIELPFSPSAEEYSIFFFKVLTWLIQNTKFNNGEGIVKISKIIVHETKSGYSIANDKSYINKHSLYDYLNNIQVNFDNCEGRTILQQLLESYNRRDEKIFKNEKPEQQIIEQNNRLLKL